MKRILSLTVALLMLISAGCAAKPVVPDSPPTPPASFTSNITAVFGEHTVTAKFTQSSPGICTLDFLTPATIEPLEISYNSGSCTVTYDNLKFETDLSRFPQTAFGSVMVDTFKKLADETDVSCCYADGLWTYSGDNSAGKFTLTQNYETGFWQLLTVESVNLKIDFTDFSLI